MLCTEMVGGVHARRLCSERRQPAAEACATARGPKEASSTPAYLLSPRAGSLQARHLRFKGVQLGLDALHSCTGILTASSCASVCRTVGVVGAPPGVAIAHCQRSIRGTIVSTELQQGKEQLFTESNWRLDYALAAELVGPVYRDLEHISALLSHRMHGASPAAGSPTRKQPQTTAAPGAAPLSSCMLVQRFTRLFEARCGSSVGRALLCLPGGARRNRAV